ncbi:MAG TPA: rod shape-determining protein MreD [Ferrovibrio sp.]|uniref:rod shape-determining protein MreD n=1 Tax=Ferrovibrio sp. TaxID=1917215 RepID=UPI002ED2D776
MSVLLRQAGHQIRALLPMLSSLALVLAGLLPIGLPHFGSVSPALALMSVFYWSIFRSDLMTMAGAFLIGLILDLLSGGPPGLNALTLLLTHELGVSQRRVFLGSSFLVNWCCYALVATAAAAVSWALVCLLHWHLFPVVPVLAQWGLSLATYPMIYWLLSLLERRYLRPEFTGFAAGAR